MRGDSKFNNSEFMDFVYSVHENMVGNDIMLIYEGEVNQDITKTFTSMTQKNLEEGEASLPIKKRVYHVMVECLQNIGKHTDNIESGLPEIPGTGIFMVSKSTDGYFVVTGNPVANTRVAAITEMIETVNGMDRDEIKAYYKKKILESRISDKGGAGLGFIDIVKKTGNKIEFHFRKINDIASFFIMKTYIN